MNSAEERLRQNSKLIDKKLKKVLYHIVTAKSCDYFFWGDVMENTIEIKGVNKYYGRKQALYDINLTIGNGMFGLIGRNGAGKTTLMKLLAALHKKKNGTITVCGVPIEKEKEIRGMTGYLPQDFSLYPSMTVDESLEYLGILSGMKKEERHKRRDMLITKVNLNQQRHKKVIELSGGMRRRLGIAQALLHDPKILIVDEPTAGLDPEERIRFRNLLSEVAGDRIVILSTHIVGDIEASCENLAVMNEGRILWSGKVKDLIAQAEGKVYSVNADARFINQIRSKYTVTNTILQGEYVRARLVSDVYPDMIGAKTESPDLEDAYIWCLKSHGCNVMGGDY